MHAISLIYGCPVYNGGQLQVLMLRLMQLKPIETFTHLLCTFCLLQSTKSLPTAEIARVGGHYAVQNHSRLVDY